MSKNISSLSSRKGLTNNLFEQLSKAKDDDTKRSIAKDFLIGESIVKGATSFYDFIEGENAQKKVYVCNGSSCLCAGTQPSVTSELLKLFKKEDVGHVSCLGRCHENHSFQISGNNYSGQDIQRLNDIVQGHETSKEKYYVGTIQGPSILTANIPDVSKYYDLFYNECLASTHNDILEKLVDSGLRGRGGAGFPTGIKWKACKDVVADEKYIVCNADEGDPGAFTDRYLLEHCPHSVLFGMLLAGWCTGAKTGILYIRGEYPDSILACEKAIHEFHHIQESQPFSPNFKFQFKIIRGAGAYICGEETALLRSIEGQRPIVSVRPPFPVVSGLFNQPTVVNNVETFASIHWILKNGSKAYKKLGNGKSTGTKLLSLDHSFNRPGVYETEMGTPLSDVINAAQGLSLPLKALQIGGPLGGIVPMAKVNDLTVDFESFTAQGFLLGHASIIGIPHTMPIIEYMAHLFEFTAIESCGKCFPCRLGATRGKEMLNASIQRKSALDEELLNDLLETMELGSLCALGGGVPLPIKNALTYFKDELSPFIKDPSIQFIEVTQ